MNDSILSTIKEILSNGSYFEPDLILYANSAFSILNQIGIGPESGFRITGDSETWGSLGLEPRILDMVKDYLTNILRWHLIEHATYLRNMQVEL